MFLSVKVLLYEHEYRMGKFGINVIYHWWYDIYNFIVVVYGDIAVIEIAIILIPNYMLLSG